MRSTWLGRAALAGLAGGLVAFGAATGVEAAGGMRTSPCDYAAGTLRECVPALGPLLDVTWEWRALQAATMQLVPISDYASDPEDGPPPLGVGTCGGETQHAAADGSTVPDGEVVAAPPAGVPAPPGTHGPYCLLHYFAADFSGLCAGCHRMLIDYADIPWGNGTSPGADGHWAGRFSASQLDASAPYDGHSPNIKNLCADKFFNPSPGATCTLYATTDRYGLEFEGDSAVYHHYPLEGRYYNGPQYLAGDGSDDAPYHWVHGAYFDVRPPAGVDISMWYGVGYRGRGDRTKDTDQSYGCLCEVPPIGHMAYSASYRLSTPPKVAGSSGGGREDRGGNDRVVANNAGNPELTALPDTGAATGMSGTASAVAALLAFLVGVPAGRRRRHRRGAAATPGASPPHRRR